MIELGRNLIPAAIVAAALSVVCYLLAHRAGASEERPTAILRLARFAFYLQTGCVEVAAAVLLSGILTHRFDLDYIYSHSSTDLPTSFLVSTFWSGQEGTFLLWALYGSIFGCALIARCRDWEPTVMLAFGILQMLVLGLLLASSPFKPLDLGHFPAADVATIKASFGGIPPEGQGLNKLLQNPWMVIHPPILFLGFASLMVPFAFAIAGLLRGDPDGWVWRAQGWTLLAFSLLGTGLILGGYWAYETLGWGGYWAWDPVENSSFVPWLFSGALFHGMILQKATGGGKRRRNLVLAGLAFGAVCYGSYLNRSGVLSDFSVHSFVALSHSFNRALLCFALVPPLLFTTLYLRRRREIIDAPFEGEALSRRRLLDFTVYLLALSAGIVVTGNSWPLISGVLSKVPVAKHLVPTQSSLQASFYNLTHTPLAMLLMVLMALAIPAGWQAAKRDGPAATLKLPLQVASATALVTFLLIAGFVGRHADTPEVMMATAGKLGWAWGTVIVLAALTATVNVRALHEDYRAGRRLLLGSHIAHLGFNLLLIGVVASSVYTTQRMVELAKDEPQQVAGYELTYLDLEPRHAEDAEVRFLARRGSDTDLLIGVLRPNQDGMIRNPAIKKTLTHDLYLEPGEVHAGQPAGALLLALDQPAAVGDRTLRFTGFDLAGHDRLNPDDFRVGVGLEVTQAGKTTTVQPWFHVHHGEVLPEPVELPGGGTVAVLDMPPQGDAGDRAILLQITGSGIAGRPETAVVQVTVKPLMSVVWLGCWLLIGGSLWSALRRARDAAVQYAAEHPLSRLLGGAR